MEIVEKFGFQLFVAFVSKLLEGPRKDHKFWEDRRFHYFTGNFFANHYAKSGSFCLTIQKVVSGGNSGN